MYIKIEWIKIDKERVSINESTSTGVEENYKVFYEITKDNYDQIHDNYYKLVDKASKFCNL